MPTIFDRLLGRDTEQKAVVTGNGGTGPGVFALIDGVPLSTRARNPRRLMKQAQELYHSDLIIRAAEHRTSAAVAGLPWHLEDENQDEVTDESSPELIAIRDWLERPQANLRDVGRKMTRRALWQVTSRHAGLCGSGFWFLDQRNALTNMALSALYINPARMYPQENELGYLRGWKLDADEDGNGGIPLELDEVLQFDFEPPDWGHFGIGLVESAWTTAHLTSALDRHATGVFRGGGRLAGLISPKPNVQVSDDQWDAAIRDWRNIQSDPESAKRLHILRGPVDFTRTAASMQELAVEHVAKMAREDKLALWGVPLSQLPLPVAAGMNSGETKAFDEAVFYQGAVHDRVLILSEVIQTQVLDRIAAEGGPAVTLVIEEPAFDDETPMFERAEKARTQPLTVNERRAIIRLDPLPDLDAKGEPLGTAIYLPTDLVLVNAGPDENGNLIALPEPEPPPAALVAPPEPSDGEEAPPSAVPAKATLEGLRKRIDGKHVAEFEKDMAAALREQAQAIAKRIRSRGSAIAKKPRNVGAWWDEAVESARIGRVIEKHNLAVAKVVTGEVPRLIPKKADFTDEVFDFIRLRTGERISGINDTTRDSLADLIAEGFEQGLGPDEVAQSIEDAGIFAESRAELVARTETMLAYNDAALRSYQSLDVTEVMALDGDKDAECADRNGKTFSIDDAYAISDHPNGTLDWAPVVKASLEPRADAPHVDEGRQYIINVPPNPTPIVHVHPTPVEVNVAPAEVTVLPTPVTVNPTPVTVEAPIVNVPEQKATLPEVMDVRIVDDVSPPKVKKVIRGAPTRAHPDGPIEGVVEGTP